MFLIIKVIILAALIRLLINNGKPFLCAGIYTAVGLVLHLVMSTSLLVLVLATAVSFALACLYFWLLDRFQDNLLVFWIIAILGVALTIV